MEWIKSKDCDGGSCVEVAFEPDLVAVRNGQSPADVLWFTYDEWEAFLNGTKLGEFDL